MKRSVLQPEAMGGGGARSVLQPGAMGGGGARSVLQSGALGAVKRALNHLYRMKIGALLKPITILTRWFGRRPSTEPRNILVMRFGLLGDGALLIPALRDLRGRLTPPHRDAGPTGMHGDRRAHIDVLATPLQAPLLEALVADGTIDGVVIWSSGDLTELHRARHRDNWTSALATLAILRANRYDLAFSCYGHLGSAVALLAGIPVRIGFGSEAFPGTLTRTVPGTRYTAGVHESSYNLAVIDAGFRSPSHDNHPADVPSFVPRETSDDHASGETSDVNHFAERRAALIAHAGHQHGPDDRLTHPEDAIARIPGAKRPYIRGDGAGVGVGSAPLTTGSNVPTASNSVTSDDAHHDPTADPTSGGRHTITVSLADRNSTCDRFRIPYAQSHLGSLPGTVAMGEAQVTRSVLQSGATGEGTGACGAETDTAGYVVLHPGATNGSAKRWPINSWQALAKSLVSSGRTIVIVGSADDRHLGQQISDELVGQGPDPRKSMPATAWGDVRDLTGLTTVRDLIAILANASVVVTGDSGPLHVAVAVGTPVVAIHGPTDPAVCGPIVTTPDRAIILGATLACRPCYTLARIADCPLGHAICQDLITPRQVLTAISRFAPPPTISGSRR
jgi:ADP-heptose:LPS heptosyltransferase